MALDTIVNRTKRRRLPAVDVPRTNDDEIRRSLEALKEHIRMYEGDSGAPKERFVTIEELELTGLIGTKIQNNFALIDSVGGNPVSQGQQDGQSGGTTIINEGDTITGATTLLGLSDTAVSSANAGDFLQYSGGIWTSTSLTGDDQDWTGKPNFIDCIRISGIDGGYVDFQHDSTDLNITGDVSSDVNLTNLNLNLQSNFGVEWDGVPLLFFEGGTINDPFLADTTLVANFIGTDGDTTYIDGNGTAYTFFGDSEISSAQFFSSPTSIYCGSGTSGNYVEANDNAIALMGNSNFTIECHVYPLDDDLGPIMGCNKNPTDTTWRFWMGTNNNATCNVSDSGGGPHELKAGINTVNENTWTHLAFCRQGVNLYWFVNGVLKDTATMSSASATIYDTGTPTAAFRLGSLESSINYLNGYIDNLRITKGVARYTETFTPPAVGTEYTEPSGQTFVVGDAAFDTQIDGPTTVTDDFTVDGIANFEARADFNGVDGTRHYDAAGNDYLEITHSNTFATILTTGSDSGVVPINFPQDLRVGGGGINSVILRVQDGAASGLADFYHDATDFITGFTNTTDWTVTGLTAFNLVNYTFDVDQTVGAGEDGYVLGYTDSTGEISLVPAGGLSIDFDSLTDVDLTGAANNDLLFRSGGNWIDTAGLLTWDGSTLVTQGTVRIQDGGGTDWLDQSHNGTDFLSAFTNTADWTVTGLNTVSLGNFTFDVDQTVGAGQDDYVLTYDNGTGLISLELAAGGGGSNATPLEVIGDIDIPSPPTSVAVTAELRFIGNDEVETGSSIGHFADGDLILRNYFRGKTVDIYATTSGGTDSRVVAFAHNSGTTDYVKDEIAYFQNIRCGTSRTIGFSEEDPPLRVVDNNLGSSGEFDASIAIWGSGDIQSYSSGVTTSDLRINPQGSSVVLYDGGTSTARTVTTANGGLEVNNTAQASGFSRVLIENDRTRTSYLNWQFSTTTTATDPGAGKFQMNNATPASVTEVYINDAGFWHDHASVLDTVAIGDVIHFQDDAWDSRNTDFITATISSVTDNTGWYTLGVTIDDSDQLMTNNRVCAFVFSKGAASGGLPSGTADYTLVYDGANWISSDHFRNFSDGDVGIYSADDAVATASALQWYTNSGTLRAELGPGTNGSDFAITNWQVGRNIELRSRNAADSATRTFLDGDPDGVTIIRGNSTVQLYGGNTTLALRAGAGLTELLHAGTEVAQTETLATGGFSVHNDYNGSDGVSFDRVWTETQQDWLGATALYEWDTGTGDANPGNGQIRGNNATMSSITFLYVDYDLWAGTRHGEWLFNSLSDGDLIMLRSNNDIDDYWIGTINGSVTDATTYFKLPVTHIASGSNPTSGDLINISCQYLSHAGGGGGSQTPWTSDIDAATFDLTNLAELRINAGTDVDPTSTTHPFQIGASSGANIRMDENEIMAVNNGSVQQLSLSVEGGGVGVNQFGGNTADVTLYEECDLVFDGAASGLVTVTHTMVNSNTSYTITGSGMSDFELTGFDDYLFSGTRMELTDNYPIFIMNEEDASSNEKRWSLSANSGILRIGTMTDASTSVTEDGFILYRTGTAFDRCDIRTGIVRITEAQASANYMSFEHDGTDFNFDGVNVTDLNITGVTAINAGTVDADFDAITATSYGGIPEAELASVTTATTAELIAIANAINTSAAKVAGYMVFNTTTGAPVWAVGSADGSVWNDATGTLAHTPV